MNNLTRNRLVFTGLLSLLAASISANPLEPCPDSPNCVSTFATTEYHSIQPIPYSGTREQAMTALLAYLNERNRERIKILETTPEYVHAVFITRFFRFRDDVEFYLPEEEKVIHFRSASRIGYGDMGANRKRMEAIREALADL